jgi:glycosyltransferase involved in cell wall biosynthesis
MRIGIDVSPLTKARTGVGEYTRALLRHLLRRGGDCTFHGFSSGWGEMDADSLMGLSRHCHIPLPTRVLYKGWEFIGAPKVDRLLGGLDVFHATNYYLPPVASAKRIATFYDLAFLRVPELCSPKIVGPFSRNVARFAREADAILVCSECTKQDVVELLDVAPSKVTVAYGAVEEGFTPVAREEASQALKHRYGIDSPFVLFVSTIEPRKNIPGLIAAFAHVAHDFPHKLLLVGGAGWNSEGLDALISQHGLTDRVLRLGYVADRSDLPLFYSAADVFVFPSFYEGFGLPVLEAMACGCPVVTSNRTSLPEVGGAAAAYADPDHEDTFAEVLLHVLSDAGSRETMRALGLEQAKRFSWEKTTDVTLDLYRRLGG